MGGGESEVGAKAAAETGRGGAGEEAKHGRKVAASGLRREGMEEARKK